MLNPPQMVSQWPFYLNFIYKTFDHFNSQILSRLSLLSPQEQHYIIHQNHRFKTYFTALQKIYLVYKRIKNSYSFFTSSLHASKENGFLPFTGSVPFIQIDQLLMDMMDALINLDLYLVNDSSNDVEPFQSGMCARSLGKDSCPVCLFPMGDQLLNDTMWRFHTLCFNFYSHLK